MALLPKLLSKHKSLCWQVKFSIHCSVVGAWKGLGKAMPGNKMGKHLFTLLSFVSWSYIYGNNLRNTQPSVFIMPLSGSHKSIQCLSTSVNNKWRIIIEHLAKNLSVSPGRTLMWGGGVQRYQSEKEVFHTGLPEQQQLLLYITPGVPEVPWVTAAGDGCAPKLFKA